MSTSYDTELIKQLNADELELGMDNMTEQEISELFQEHFSDFDDVLIEQSQ